jgi:hypothetical protein
MSVLSVNNVFICQIESRLARFHKIFRCCIYILLEALPVFVEQTTNNGGQMYQLEINSAPLVIFCTGSFLLPQVVFTKTVGSSNVLRFC